MKLGHILKNLLPVAALLLGAAQSLSAQRPPETLLVVLTHSDDPIAIAPLIAKYAAAGHPVYYALFTGVQDSALARDASPSRAELTCATRALGARDAFVMSGPAGEGANTSRAVATKLREVIEEVKPAVVITWGPDGLTGHPRHILVGNVVTRVLQNQTGLTHRPRKLYYIAYPQSRFPDTREHISGIADVTGPFGTVKDEFITTRVNGSAHAGAVKAAIACHTLTQEPPAVWQPAWDDRVNRTLGGIVHLRLVLGPATKRESSIFENPRY